MLATFFIVLVQLCLLAFIIRFLMWSFGAHTKSQNSDTPFVPTPSYTFDRIFTALDIKPSDVVYELGSGDGRFLLYCARREPRARYVGIEHDPLLIGMAHIRAYFSRNSKNVEFRRGDFFATNLAGVTKMYSYLLNSVMDELLPKLNLEFSGRLASRACVFREKEPTTVVSLSKVRGGVDKRPLYLYDF